MHSILQGLIYLSDMLSVGWLASRTPSFTPMDMPPWCRLHHGWKILDTEAAALEEGELCGCSTTSDMAVVMTLLFGRADGKEQAVRGPDVGGASAKAAPRSRSGGLARGQ
jgi:hypothetical protein